VLIGLADLPFRTYVTTAADELLMRALRFRRSKRPRADFCRWHEALRSSSLATTFEEDPHYVPSVEEPFVFHLHGQIAVAESLVVAEDDHFDMLVQTARHPSLIPRQCSERCAAGRCCSGSRCRTGTSACCCAACAAATSAGCRPAA
jgi:hypothetical protein